MSADADVASELDRVVVMDSSINGVRTNTPPPAVWLSPIPKMTQGPGPNDNDRLPWGPRSGSGEVALNRLITPWAVPGVVHQQAAPDLRRPRSSVVNRTDQGQCQRHHHAPAQQWPRSACRGSCGLEYRILLDLQVYGCSCRSCREVVLASESVVDRSAPNLVAGQVDHVWGWVLV